ncbi:hypothetical protein S245_043433, partial [Arachis hypogaea]
VLAVKKLEKRVCDHQEEEDFLELVNGINNRRVYWVLNGSLNEALHSEDEFKTRLTWNACIRIALGAARALEYLHEQEQCQPAVIHRNFKSANILLDNDL